MSVYFVDTSALAKRYIPEAGRQWLLSWILPKHGHVIVIAHTTLIELNSVLAATNRRGHLSQVKMGLLRFNFIMDARNQYLVVPVDLTVVTNARRLVYKHKLRTLDAIQLACAIETKKLSGISVTFVAGDNDLKSAAQNEGFIVEDPHSYPSLHDK